MSGLHALDALTCADVEKLVQLYVDGELDAAERVRLDEHIAGCLGCRDLVAFQTSFKADLRARLRRPTHTTPEELRANVLAALDRADAHGHGPVMPVRRWAVPAGAVLAAAAMALLAFQATRHGGRDTRLLEAAVRAHEKNLPVEVAGSPDNVKAWMMGKMSVPVRPPRLPMALVGARLGHLNDRDVAQLVYRRGATTITGFVFDASGWEMTGPSKRVLGHHDVYVGQVRGYNVILYRDQGVGYAYASDLDGDDLVKAVSASFEDAPHDVDP